MLIEEYFRFNSRFFITNIITDLWQTIRRISFQVLEMSVLTINHASKNEKNFKGES